MKVIPNVLPLPYGFWLYGSVRQLGSFSNRKSVNNSLIVWLVDYSILLVSQGQHICEDQEMQRAQCSRSRIDSLKPVITVDLYTLLQNGVEYINRFEIYIYKFLIHYTWIETPKSSRSLNLMMNVISRGRKWSLGTTITLDHQSASKPIWRLKTSYWGGLPPEYWSTFHLRGKIDRSSFLINESTRKEFIQNGYCH